MGVVIPFGGAPACPVDDIEDAFEPDPALIKALELAMRRAREGDMVSFIMVYEAPRGSASTIWHTDGSPDLGILLAGMLIEQHRLTQFLADNQISRPAPPDEGA